jgi:hypothetical protein
MAVLYSADILLVSVDTAASEFETFAFCVNFTHTLCLLATMFSSKV